MKVENMTGNNGNKVKNQFVIDGVSNHFIIDGYHDVHFTGKMFQSYDSNIAFISTDGKVLIDIYMWNYSKTTGKYRNIFLGENKAETQRKIDNGTYILTDLNA